MGQDLYQVEPASRAVFDLADEKLQFSLSEICFSGPEENLKDTVNQQPALFVTSIAAWQAMKARDWATPEYVAGHSLGELTALVVAESLDFEDGLMLVRKRGQLMKAAGEREPGAMAAILGLDIERVILACDQAREMTARPVQIANDNCPGQVVISGDKVALETTVELARAAGARKVIQLPISIAAHSPLMASASAEFAEAIATTSIKKPRVPIIGNVAAEPLTTPEAIREELKAQLTSPVQWRGSMRYLLSKGVNTFVEVGPGEVLLGLMKRIDRKIERVKLKL
jgi:[acyl-carrier-protein] S-malonyltransferase